MGYFDPVNIDFYDKIKTVWYFDLVNIDFYDKINIVVARKRTMPSTEGEMIKPHFLPLSNMSEERSVQDDYPCYTRKQIEGAGNLRLPRVVYQSILGAS